MLHCDGGVRLTPGCRGAGPSGVPGPIPAHACTGTAHHRRLLSAQSAARPCHRKVWGAPVTHPCCSWAGGLVGPRGSRFAGAGLVSPCPRLGMSGGRCDAAVCGAADPASAFQRSARTEGFAMKLPMSCLIPDEFGGCLPTVWCSLFSVQNCTSWPFLNEFPSLPKPPSSNINYYY